MNTEMLKQMLIEHRHILSEISKLQKESCCQGKVLFWTVLLREKERKLLEQVPDFIQNDIDQALSAKIIYMDMSPLFLFMIRDEMMRVNNWVVRHCSDQSYPKTT
ncbi:hypothetical protein [Reichenbachiella versicolor]|uniref:hypothetical protein n=1 Tax=Reichenbachiella versicolor TaxID=1821036 RepID=UPI000D6E5C98|nr:hypothetical protein [Reichenbachiella versicolor]